MVHNQKQQSRTSTSNLYLQILKLKARDYDQTRTWTTIRHVCALLGSLKVIMLTKPLHKRANPRALCRTVTAIWRQKGESFCTLSTVIDPLMLCARKMENSGPTCTRPIAHPRHYHITWVHFLQLPGFLSVSRHAVIRRGWSAYFSCFICNGVVLKSTTSQ